jgi:group I intron endonuclease
VPETIIGITKNRKMKKLNNVIVGIYKITNPKGKVYIGQSININRRFSRYKNIREEDKQYKIFNSIKKYGWENHIFEIIEECSIEQLNERETYWKRYYLSQFKNIWEMVLFCNIYDTGGGPLSEETKLKISNSTKGKTVSEATKTKMSESKKGKPNFLNRKPRKEGSGGNISKGKIGKKPNKIYSNKNKPNYLLRKPILQYDIEGNFIKEWSCQAEAVKSTNSPSIQRVLKGKIKTSGGYIWKYKE